MSVNKIDTNYSMARCISLGIDAEEEEILRRLYYQYGITGTGVKSIDKAKLHELELRDAKTENTVSTKFLTISKNEQEKIQKNKKDKKIEQNPKAYPDTFNGSRILGEQLYLAIKMKKDIDKTFKEKQRKKV